MGVFRAPARFFDGSGAPWLLSSVGAPGGLVYVDFLVGFGTSDGTVRVFYFGFRVLCWAWGFQGAESAVSVYARPFICRIRLYAVKGKSPKVFQAFFACHGAFFKQSLGSMGF